MSLSITRRDRATPRRRARGGLAGAAAALLVATAVAFAGPAAAAPAAPAPACPTGPFAFTSTLGNGAFQIGKQASSTGASATACGQITSTNGALGSVVAKGNVSFAPTTTKVGVLNLPTTVTALTDLSGPAALTANGIDVSLKGSVLVTTVIFGSNCSFPLDLNLTTGRSGSLTGTPLVGGLDGISRGKLVTNDFAVPALKPSWACNILLTSLTNGLLGLPLGPGASSISFDLALKLGV